MVRNRANAPLALEISAVDSQGICSFKFAKAQFVAEPGRRDGTTFVVRPKKHIWVGRSVDRRFDVAVRATVGESAAPPRNGGLPE